MQGEVTTPPMQPTMSNLRPKNPLASERQHSDR